MASNTEPTPRLDQPAPVDDPLGPAIRWAERGLREAQERLSDAVDAEYIARREVETAMSAVARASNTLEALRRSVLPSAA